MSKYKPLADHLKESGKLLISMTFDEIERVIGAKLPQSANKYRAWWSNNPTNSVITQAWLDAGYKTENVNMQDRELAFRKTLPEGTSREMVYRQQIYRETDADGAMADSEFILHIYGALKGTVTILPGTDLTLPAGED